MNEPGVGRSGGLTDWHLMDVASMWACLKDQDTTNQWRQVAGWRKVCDLAQAHLGRLQAYRRGLALVWPPETNAAARTYLAELDQLITQVQHTHDAASTNYTALAAATQAIGTTRTALKKIHDEYAAKLQQKRSFEATAADPKAIAGGRVSEPPVTDADLERLNVQARGIMYSLSGELQQAQVMLRQPPAPTRTKPGLDQTPPEGQLVSGASAPTIPPILPMAMPAMPAPSVPRTSTPQPILAPSSGVGPVLGGAGPSLAPSPTASPGAPGVTPSAGNTSPSYLGVPPTPTPIPGSGHRPDIKGPSQIKPGRPMVGGNNTSSPHAMPPGGLIGGTSSMGLSQPGASNAQPRRINPIGGVIGGGAAGTAPSGGAGSRPGGGRSFSGSHAFPPIGGSPNMGNANMSALGNAPERASRRDRNGKELRQWDPDHPWQTDQGVSPVVRPPDDEGPIDPGPAIGISR
ncbi:hypothetical protein QTQ03_23835 [Micromonospora sp. WMMA1363]|uniref:hypothetical protein n=1 Tax=Micromonospora sp. WMMA1363 TaxID=3053985 RepID=UPI00259CA2B2|nr:hypothetical protein [Micromonospora sp. WMMA1363]MDM4722470.1 hypothetical protein [Micromonospora sp. WMMA1363]